MRESVLILKVLIHIYSSLDTILSNLQDNKNFIVTLFSSYEQEVFKNYFTKVPQHTFREFMRTKLIL